MLPILEQAKIATNEGNFSLALSYLQQLISEHPNLTTSENQLVLELALTILENGDFELDWRLAKIIPKLGTIGIKPLIAILENSQQDPDARYFAAQILGNFTEPAVIISLAKILQETEEDELKEICASTLANLNQKAIAPLAQLLENPADRLLATRCLAQIPSSAVVEPLLTIVNDSDPEVRATALAALSNFSDARIPPLLIAALQDLAASVRKAAVMGLATKINLIPADHLIKELSPLLQDINLEVCQQTALTLSKIKADDAAQALWSNLQSPALPHPLQLTLINCLAWLETDVSLDYLKQALALVDETGRLAIIRALGRIKSLPQQPKAAAILIDYLTLYPWQSPAIKQALAHAWGQLKIPAAIPLLQQLATDSETGVRLHALKALQQLNRDAPSV